MAKSQPDQPVKSAKDAINAMYAQDSATKLSDYLASSAEKLSHVSADASKKSSASKSASHLHQKSTKANSHRLESVRPSASAILRPAGSDPSDDGDRPITVVRTSLKLGPKKPMATHSPAARQSQLRDAALLPKKSQIKISEDSPAVRAIKDAASAVTAAEAKARASAMRSQKSPKKSVPRPPRSRNPHVFQDIMRPATPKRPQNTSHNSIISHDGKKVNENPSESSPKTTFKAAPRGFAAHNAKDVRKNSRKDARLQAEAFLNPSFSIVEAEIATQPKSLPASSEKEAIHIYGMTEGPEPFSGVPSWEEPALVEHDLVDSQLGIVEDYHPGLGDAFVPPETENLTISRHTHSDSGRYALSSASPYFLPSANIEKRPLSDGDGYLRDQFAAVHANKQAVEVPHNIYAEKPNKKVKKSQKVKPTKTPKSPKPIKRTVKKSNDYDQPTVIIPVQTTRPHVPIFLLLIATIILGATVGALVYLFFFQ